MSRNNKRGYELTADKLQKYLEAALNNSHQLTEESSHLMDGGFYARSYFLSVAAIEEAGKSYLAFLGKSRKLIDPAVQSKLKKNFEDHQLKTLMAFIPWMEAESRASLDLEPMFERANYLISGRELSMYVDFEQISGDITCPSNLVGVEQAKQCLSIACKVKQAVESAVSVRNNPVFSDTGNQFYLMKTKELTEVVDSEDFQNFLLHELSAHPKPPFDLATCIGKFRQNRNAPNTGGANADMPIE